MPKSGQRNNITSSADIKTRIESSAMTSECKSIFKILVEYLQFINTDRDARVTKLEQKVEANCTKVEMRLEEMDKQLHQISSSHKK